MWQLGSRQPQPAGLRPTWQRKDALPQRDESGMEERKSTLCRAPGHTAGVKGIKQTDMCCFFGGRMQESPWTELQRRALGTLAAGAKRFTIPRNPFGVTAG